MAPTNQDIAHNTVGFNSMTRRPGPQKVFVYGTLKKGQGNHEYYLRYAKPLGAARIEGLMFHLGGCPAINLTEAFTSIFGEVYEVLWDDILHLDMLEGVANGFYTRIEARVEPHGVVWMYIFPHHKAAAQEWIIPGGNWTGRDTQKVKWLGFGKGIEIGAFEANQIQKDIKVGQGDGNLNWILKYSPKEKSYKLISKTSQEVLGEYYNLSEMIAYKKRETLQLPRVESTPSSSGTVTIADVIRRTQAQHAIQQHPSVPIVWTPEEMAGLGSQDDEEESLPQAARMLGYKYGEA